MLDVVKGENVFSSGGGAYCVATMDISVVVPQKSRT